MILRGFPAIKKALGVSCTKAVIGYARRLRDPLPLVRWRTTVQIDSDVLARWKRRDAAKDSRRNDPDLSVVEGIIAIAACIGKDVDTVRSYARLKRDPLPINGLGTRYPWIWRSALEDWYERQAIPWQVGDKRE